MKSSCSVFLGWIAICGCSSTTDHLGQDEPTQSTEPPPFTEVLGKSADEIDEKLEQAFQQLFYGDPNDQAIYVEDGTTGAYVVNVYADDRRTDGLGYAMYVTVQLDKREEFDRLWELGTSSMRYESGPRSDFLYWECGVGECPDPNGTSYAATALLLAEDRWDEPSYGEDARALLAAMLHKVEQNGGVVVDDVHSMVDADTGLVVSSPIGELASETTTSFLMPAFYEYWAEKVPEDADAWRRSAAAARAYLAEIAHTETGLVPERGTLDGEPLSDRFGVESYRVGLNIAVDHAWYGHDEALPVVERALEFFAGQGDYVAAYTLDGAPQATWDSVGLMATNGAAASVVDSAETEAFVQAVWDMPIPTGQGRTYDGLLYLLSLMHLSGRFQPG